VLNLERADVTVPYALHVDLFRLRLCLQIKSILTLANTLNLRACVSSRPPIRFTMTSRPRVNWNVPDDVMSLAKEFI
jgi:hypothetical protein